MVRSFSADQNTIAASAYKDIYWEFQVTRSGPVTTYWSTRAITSGDSSDGNAYTYKIEPSSFKGVTINRSKSDSGIQAPSSLTFTVTNAGNVLTASNYADAVVVLRMMANDAVPTGKTVMRTWTFIVRKCEDYYQNLYFTCEDFLTRQLVGQWPTSKLVKDLFPSDDPEFPKIQQDSCVPVPFGTAYIPLRSVYVTADTERFYVLGPSARTYYIDEVRSPREWGNKSVWKNLTWLAGATANEFYAVYDAKEDDPKFSNTPTRVLFNGTEATNGTAGSLNQGEWGYSDGTLEAPVLGYSTVYVRLSDDSDPDGKAANYVSVDFTFTQSTKTDGDAVTWDCFQPIIADSDNDGLADAAGLWKPGDYFLDLPTKFSRDDTKDINGSSVGTHTGANDAAVLTNSSKTGKAAWVASSLIGAYVVNETDGSYGRILANTSNTVTATLAGGTGDDWDTNDVYTIGGPASILRFILTDSTYGMGVDATYIDDTSFGIAEKTFVGLDLEFNGAYWFKQEREAIIAEFLIQCSSVLVMTDKIELHMLTGTKAANSVATLTGSDIIKNSFRNTISTRIVSDSGSVAFPNPDDSQDMLISVTVSAKGSTANISSKSIKTPLLYGFDDATKYSQNAAALSFQRQFLLESTQSFKTKGTVLKVDVDDTIYLNSTALYGPAIYVRVDAISYGKDGTLSFNTTKLTSAGDDWGDLAFSNLTIGTSSTGNTIASYSIIQVGPNGLVSEGELQNVIPNPLRVGATGNYIFLDPADPLITMFEGAQARVEIGLTGVGEYGMSVYKANGDTVIEVNTTHAQLSGWDLTPTAITADSGVVGMSSAITGGVDWRFWAGHATPGSAPFRVDEAGLLYAAGATVSGTITATAGNIGGWFIDATSIYTGTEDHSGYTANAGDITLYSDGANSSIHAKNFYIDASGNITAQSVTLTGVINAATGYIGGASGWIIATGKITSSGIGLATAAGDATYAFWAGNNTPASAEFSVRHTGALVASSATVTGVINADSGLIGNWTVVGNTIKSLTGSGGIILDSSDPTIKITDSAANEIIVIGLTDATPYYGIKIVDPGGNILLHVDDNTNVMNFYSTTTTIIKSGGNITVDQGGDIIMTGGGAGNPSLIRFGDTVVPGEIRYEQSGDSSKYWTIYKNTGGGVYDDALIFMPIGFAGNGVGIGITAPEAMLHVTTALTGSIAFKATNTGTAAATHYGLQSLASGAGNANIGGYFSATNGTVNNYGVYIAAPPALASNFALYSNSAAQSYFNGSVGINITTPASLLEIYHPTAHPILTITAAHATAYDPQIQFRTDASPTVKFSMGVDGADDKFKIFSGSGIGGTSEFVIDGSGNVGIGTTVPGTYLDIEGSNSAVAGGEDVLRLRSQGAGATLGSGARITFTNYTASTEVANIGAAQESGSSVGIAFEAYNSGMGERVRITGAGNVGIGTTVPDGPLHIFVATATTTASANADDFIIENGTNPGMSIMGAGHGSIFFGDTASNASGSIRYNHTVDQFTWTTGNGIRMSLDSSGYLGIGTTVPDGPLHTYTAGAIYAAHIENTASGATNEGLKVTIGSVAGASALTVITGSGTALDILGARIVYMPGYANGTTSFSGGTGLLATASDMRLKIADGYIDDPISIIMGVNSRFFYWDKDKVPEYGNDRQLGFFAQELNVLLPEAAPMTMTKDGEQWGIYDRAILGLHHSGLQNHEIRLQSLEIKSQDTLYDHENRIAELEEENVELKEKVAMLLAA